MAENKGRKPVGSRNRRGIRTKLEIPINLERILLRAAEDREFRDALLTDAARAPSENGFALRSSERAMLSAMPRTLLEKLIERFRPDKLKRSRFARHVAAAFAGSMVVTATACGDGGDGASRGAAPDFPEDGGAAEGGGAGGGPVIQTGGSGGGGVMPDPPPDDAGWEPEEDAGPDGGDE